jgi:mono/diheme cytochrome c family protein
MRTFLLIACAFLIASFAGWTVRGFPQDKAEAKMTPEDVAKKNPIPPTSEGLAEARKLYGYDCAMCHGKDGDGKGELAAEMKLELHDWRDPASLEKMTDGEIFFVVSNGRGKMVGGEGDRSSEKMRWNLVNLVRSFAKKGSADKPKTESPQQ